MCAHPHHSAHESILLPGLEAERGGSSAALGEGRRKHQRACACLFQLLETRLHLRAQGAQTTHAWPSSSMALIFICVRSEQNRLARSNDEHVMIRGPQQSRQAEQASAAQTRLSAAASRLELVPPREERCCWFWGVINCSRPQREQCHHCLEDDLNMRTLFIVVVCLRQITNQAI